MRIEELLREPEGKELEYKRDFSSPTPALKAIVAFANTAGGRPVIGVTDRSRDVIGADDPLAREERLMNLIADRISPRFVPEVEFVGWRKTQLLVVEVHLGANRPYHLLPTWPEDRVYVRLGSTNRRADPALIAEMRRSARHIAYDEEPLVGLGADAIDFDAASRVVRTRATAAADRSRHASADDGAPGPCRSHGGRRAALRPEPVGGAVLGRSPAKATKSRRSGTLPGSSMFRSHHDAADNGSSTCLERHT
jgi:predicted HTH transcriptional regulator